MKFREFLKEDPMKLTELTMIDNPKRDEIVKWAAAYDRDDPEDWLTGDATLKWSKASFSLVAQLPNQKFDPPMDSNWWKILKLFTFNAGAFEASHLIENFHQVPNSGRLWIYKAKIKSFVGIEKLDNLTKLKITHAVIECGLLRLLKCKTLIDIDVDAIQLKNKPLTAALAIVNKHLKTKDIPECQQELIEEGLEEYAKL